MNILVIDAGTSSMRGILFTHEGEELIMKQQIYKSIYMSNSWVEQAPSDWENALYEILRDVCKEAEENGWEIHGIAIDSQRSSIIPVDRMIRPLGNAIMWQDKRTNDICKELEKENDTIFELSGSRVNPVFSAGKMTWIREARPDIYEKTYKFMTVSDYLICLLTGSVCTDYTYGSRSLVMNIHTCQWDSQLLELFRLERDRLCNLVEPGNVCGTVTPRIAELTGCTSGIPVITAGGDQQCGAIGQGVVKEGVVSVTAGTGGFLMAASNEIAENLQSNVICNVSSIKNQYVLESSILTCCSAFDWFRNEFYPNASYEELNKEIAKSPVGANGCLCVPYFQGRSTPDWNNRAKGLFSDITLNTRKCDMLRGLLEGICCEIENGIQVMRDYVKVSDIYISGGLTNSDIFNEIQCNVSGTKLIRCGNGNATAKGALMVAATAMGQYTTVEEAYNRIGREEDRKTYFPQQQEAYIYKKKREKMNKIYEKLYFS